MTYCSIWHLLLGIIFARFIHCVASINFPFLFWLNNISIYGSTVFCLSIHYSVDTWVVFTFWQSLIVTISVCVQVFVWNPLHLKTCLVFLVCLPRGLIYNSMFNLPMNLQIDFLSNCAILLALQEYTSILISLYPYNTHNFWFLNNYYFSHPEFAY